MKDTRFLFVLFISTFLPMHNCIAQSDLNSSLKSETFKVCNVKKADSPITYLRTYQEVVTEKMIIERDLEEKKIALAEDTSLSNQKRMDLLKDKSYCPPGAFNRKIEAIPTSGEKLIPTYFHPFVATMHLAYDKHYPMTISPDMIWLLIAQGFAAHVNQNPEKMRNYFVNFKGKKMLNIRRNEFEKGGKGNDWLGVFKEFSTKIEKNTGAELLDLITGDFSTTGSVEKAAFQITLMDAMKSYFEYSMTTSCGIPEITLEGTPEDWKKIEQKAQELAQYDLEWWIDELMPILKEFTDAASGKPKANFWTSIYKWNDYPSGDPFITGWILKFFPYREINGKLIRRKVDEKRPNYRLTATTDDFTSGLSEADFIWDYVGTFYKMEFVAGFVACQQDPKTLSLRPKISWAVIDKQAKPTEEEIENYQKGGNKEYRKN